MTTHLTVEMNLEGVTDRKIPFRLSCVMNRAVVQSFSISIPKTVVALGFDGDLKL